MEIRRFTASVPLVVALSLSFLLAGCGSGGSGGSTPPPPPANPTVTSVAVSCASATVNVGQTSQCSATVQGTGNYSSSVNWAVSGVLGGNSTVGIVSASGLYTAPATVPTPFTVSLTATSVTDTTKSASSPVIVAGKIASVSQTITAAAGGTITLPDGSSVTIAPGILPSDQSATLSEVSYLPKQPPNLGITGVGPGLILSFSTPVPHLVQTGRAMSGTNGIRPSQIAHAGAESTAPSAFLFSINTGSNNGATMNGSLPAADFVDTSGINTFMGTLGNYDSTTAIVTANIGTDQWNAFLSAVSNGVLNGVQSIVVTAVNIVAAVPFVGYETTAGIHLLTAPNQLILNINANDPTQDAWTKYTTCPTGKTLLVVHGMNAYVEDAFSTKTSTIQAIRKAGNYQSVLGFDYDWLQGIDASGTQLATFLTTVAGCSGVSIDIEAHSEGVPVSMSALNHMDGNERQKIKRLFALGGPIMGTPMANDGRLLDFIMGQAGLVFGNSVVVNGLADLLNKPFVSDLKVSTPGSNDTLDKIRTSLSPGSLQNIPQIFVAAGNTPTGELLQTLATTMTFPPYNVASSDGFIPVASALAFQPGTAGAVPAVPVLEVYPFYPFPTDHLDLITDGNIIASIGAQASNAFVSPSLILSSTSQCANNLACWGSPGTLFSLSGDGYSASTSNDNFELFDNGLINQLSGFTTQNGSIPQNSWQHTPICSTAPETVEFFAKNSTTNQSSNAVTEQVIAGSCAPAATIAVSPLAAQVPVGGHQAFTATVTGLSNTAVTWSVNGSIGGDTTVGTISAAGLYTAPTTVPSPTTVTVTATSQADASVSGSASVTIEPSGAVTVSPASVALAEGGTQQFTATVSGGGTVNWTVTGGTADGTITSAGLYTAPNTTGTFRVVATNAADTSQSFTATVTVSASAGEWTWMSGSNSIGAVGVYGTLRVPSPSNVPGGRISGVSWIDSGGSFWLFGGFGYDSTGSLGFLNDLWEFNPATKEWIWVSGSDTVNAVGVYGTQGALATTNVPGSRNDAVSWTDGSGNLWLFGGYGYDSAGTDSDLNDLWEFNPATKEWTWVSGSNTVQATGVYGTQGVPSAANGPGARFGAVSWIDSSGNLWLFGGGNPTMGFSFNDLWEFNPTTREWTWVSGSNSIGAVGVYGTLGVPSPSNVPGGRSSAVSWIDSSGNLWLFGGGNLMGFGFNDLWEFNPTTREWTWVSGSDTVNAVGVYGTLGVPSPSNVPGARSATASWIDRSGNLWLFGGEGSSSNGSSNRLNDLWKFNPSGKTWTWASGANTGDAVGVYGTQGVPSAANVPGARSGAVSWIDNSGNLWLFGSVDYLNDLWRYQP